ncbi:hypothetical protein chiPu_0025689 [Chiloscyllium punctatum]|uniref:IF rod domain-containing protein n=1 Tax=Chiloscyllium punctatum TaxID=137246 RepID=A0A401TGZ6_CHIPU|nr:hypothetical protein [Chiloscyllium punctatum]
MNKKPFSRTASSSSMVMGLTPRRQNSARSLHGDISRNVRVASYSPGSVGNLSTIGVHNTFNQQDELQGLNKRLATYLNRVKRLESSNKELEGKIQAHLAQKGNLARNWNSYEKPVVDLCKQVGNCLRLFNPLLRLCPQSVLLDFLLQRIDKVQGWGARRCEIHNTNNNQPEYNRYRREVREET